MRNSGEREWKCDRRGGKIQMNDLTFLLGVPPSIWGSRLSRKCRRDRECEYVKSPNDTAIISRTVVNRFSCFCIRFCTWSHMFDRRMYREWLRQLTSLDWRHTLIIRWSMLIATIYLDLYAHFSSDEIVFRFYRYIAIFFAVKLLSLKSINA